MATTITNDGIKLVKQEINEDFIEGSTQDPDVATRETPQSQTSLLTLSEVAANLHSAETSRTTNATESEEADLELD